MACVIPPPTPDLAGNPPAGQTLRHILIHPALVAIGALILPGLHGGNYRLVEMKRLALIRQKDKRPRQFHAAHFSTHSSGSNFATR